MSIRNHRTIFNTYIADSFADKSPMSWSQLQMNPQWVDIQKSWGPRNAQRSFRLVLSGARPTRTIGMGQWWSMPSSQNIWSQQFEDLVGGLVLLSGLRQHMGGNTLSRKCHWVAGYPMANKHIEWRQPLGPPGVGINRELRLVCMEDVGFFTMCSPWTAHSCVLPEIAKDDKSGKRPSCWIYFFHYAN